MLADPETPFMKELVNSYPSIFRGLAASCLRVLSIAFTVVLVTGSASAQMIGVTWEVDTAFYQPTTFDAAGEPLYADLEGYVTYKLFAEFTNPTDQLSAIYSDVATFGTLPFYIDAPCGCFNPELTDVLLGGNQNPAFFPIEPESVYDTYWTVGFAEGEQSIFLNEDYSSTTMCSEQEPGGIIFTTAPNAVSAGEDLRIQFAQVTTCGSFDFHGCFQVFVEGVQAPYQDWCMEGDGDGPQLVENPCEAYTTSDAGIDVISDIDCYGDFASIDVIADGAFPITYQLYDAADTTLLATQVENNEFNEIGAGDYFVAIVDGNTCRDTSSAFSFVEPTELSATWDLQEDNTCPGDSSSVIHIDYGGGTPGYNIVAFSATNTGSGVLPDSNNQWVGLGCIDGNGEWEFEITDANGCSVDTAITVSCLDPLLLQATAQDISCFGYGDGIIEGFMSGGSGTLTLAGSPNLGTNVSGEGTVNFTIDQLAAADYLLVVTDANDCQVETNVSIIEPDSVTIEVSVLDLLCAESCNGEVNIAAFGGSGDFDYSVTDAEGNPYNDEALCAGTYLANAVDGNGCVVAAPFEVLAPDSILFDVAVVDVTCNGESDGSICVENATGGTGTLSFQVDPPAGAFQFDPCFGLGAGTYVITAMDEEGCEVSSAPQLLIEPEAIQLILSPTPISCTSLADGMLTVEGIGGTGALSLIEPENAGLPFTLNDLEAGPIGVTVEDENGCLVTDAAEIEEPDSLQVEWLFLEEVACGGDCNGSAVIDFSGGTGDVELTLNGSETYDFGALCAGAYTATVTDGNGCQDSTSFEILEPEPIEVLIDVTNVTCTGMNDGAVNIFPIGGTGDITWNVLEEGIDLLNLYEGVYNITATDFTGCIEDTAFTVAADVDTDMIINMLSSPVTCWNEQDGTATASVVGGFQPIEYLWSDEDAQTTATATGLFEDTYSVVVTDSLGCTLTRVVTVDPTIGCFFIAEAITPNGDGYNDEWTVGGLEFFPTAKVRVFNRWGQELFYSVGYQERWDGRYNNAPLPVADYYYVIEFAGDMDPITGTVTLKY